jgi:hypothetical protein
MITRKEWGEFQSSGLLWFVNRTLHLFGWAIVFEYDNRPGNEDVLSAVYPARCKFRGFDDKTETAGFQNLTKYFGANSKELLKETLD